MSALTDGKITINSSPVIPPPVVAPVNPKGAGNPLTGQPNTAKIPDTAAPVTPKTPPTAPTDTPPAYDTTTGLLTAYGKSKGLPEVNVPKTDTSSKTTQTDTSKSTETPFVYDGITFSSQQEALNYAQDTAVQKAKEFGNTVMNIQNGAIPLSPGELAQISALKSQYDTVIAAQTIQNTNASGVANIRGYQTGAAEYDPMFQAKVIGSIFTAGAAKVTALQVEEAGAIATLTQKLKDGDIAAAKTAYDAYTTANDKRTEQLKKTITDTQKAIKDAADAKQKVTDGINEVAADAAANGADAKTVSAITAASSISEAIAAAGTSLQKMPSGYEGYGLYRNEMTSKGLTPLSAGEWKAQEETRQSKLKASEAYSTAYAKAKGEADAVGVSGGTTGAYADIIGTILASGKFTKDQAKAITNAINNGEEPLTVIKNNAKNIMGQTLATDLSKAETAKKQLTVIDSLLKEFYANGGKTGIFTGNLEKVSNKLGTVQDPKLVEIATKLALAMQAYRLAVTGTAASIQEDARIDNVFPGITNSEGLNKARLDATVGSFNETIDESYRQVIGPAYDTLKSAGTAPEAAKQGVDDYVAQNPGQAETVARLYEVPGATDQDVYEYIQHLNK